MNQSVLSLNLPPFIKNNLLALGYNYCNDVVEWPFHANFPLTATEWQHLQHTSATRTALDLYEEESLSGHILTLEKELDAALGGGIQLKHITEICGMPGSGRTQLCYKLCMNCQLPTWCGGLDGHALYVSAGTTCAPQRLREMAEDFIENYNQLTRMECLEDGFNVDGILNRIHTVELENTMQLIACVNNLRTTIEEIPNVRIRLLVINRISSLLKLLNGRERTNMLFKLLGHMQDLSIKYNFAIVLVNDFTTRMDANGQAYNTPSLGDSYYHRINTRVQLTENEDCIEATIVKNAVKPTICDPYLKMLVHSAVCLTVYR